MTFIEEFIFRTSECDNYLSAYLTCGGQMVGISVTNDKADLELDITFRKDELGKIIERLSYLQNSMEDERMD